MPVPMDLSRVSCSGRLRQQSPLGASCLEIAGLNGIQSCNRVGFRGLLPSCGTISHSLVKSASRECHGNQDQRTGNGGSSLCGKVELAW
jgi:hypothetical protein